jgi:hypothetical protein
VRVPGNAAERIEYSTIASRALLEQATLCLTNKAAAVDWLGFAFGAPDELAVTHEKDWYPFVVIVSIIFYLDSEPFERLVPACRSFKRKCAL